VNREDNGLVWGMGEVKMGEKDTEVKGNEGNVVFLSTKMKRRLLCHL